MGDRDKPSAASCRSQDFCIVSEAMVKIKRRDLQLAIVMDAINVTLFVYVGALLQDSSIRPFLTRQCAAQPDPTFRRVLLRPRRYSNHVPDFEPAGSSINAFCRPRSPNCSAPPPERGIPTHHAFSCSLLEQLSGTIFFGKSEFFRKRDSLRRYF